MSTTKNIAADAQPVSASGEILCESLRLAGWHEAMAKTCNVGERALHLASAAEFRRLHAESEQQFNAGRQFEAERMAAIHASRGQAPAQPQLGRPCKVGGPCVVGATSACACSELVDTDSNDAASPTPSPQAAQQAPTDGNWVAADDVQRLVRELDVALNGKEGAAVQASLCDVVAQVRSASAKAGRPLLAAQQAPAGSTPRPVTAAEHDVLMAAARDSMTLVAKGRLVEAPSTPASGAVAGWQLVPVEPTPEMLAAASIMRWRYDALLAAAPTPAAPAAPSTPATTAKQEAPAPQPDEADLQRLHNLLYQAQRTTGKTQAQAIGFARIHLANMRAGTMPEHDPASGALPEYIGNGMFKGETIQKAAEHWANWCDRRCMTGLSEFLRVVAAQPGTGQPPSAGVLRALWIAHGGTFHGPSVETGTMPEAKLLPFLQSIAAPVAKASTGDAQLTAMVDAAMVEMKNITPPLRRSECERLILAAQAAKGCA